VLISREGIHMTMQPACAALPIVLCIKQADCAAAHSMRISAYAVNSCHAPIGRGLSAVPSTQLPVARCLPQESAHMCVTADGRACAAASARVCPNWVVQGRGS
jgi:hypothetical protein